MSFYCAIYYTKRPKNGADLWRFTEVYILKL